MLAASSVPSALMNIIPGGGGRFGVFMAGILISLSIAFGLFLFIYWLIPNKKMSFRKTWRGALIAAIILEIFIILFPLYVRQFMSNYAGEYNNLESTFKICFLFFCIGQIGFAVILIFFFYYFSIILIFGAQINAHFFEEYPPLNDALGTYLSQMYEEHRDINNRESLHDDNHQQQSSTITDLGQQPRARWMNK